eukprot:Hpha_TRINITY_DN9521_c0_g1::TRINITY_DN9521_c0_g1_i1::g.114919::m.114919
MEGRQRPQTAGPARRAVLAPTQTPTRQPAKTSLSSLRPSTAGSFRNDMKAIAETKVSTYRSPFGAGRRPISGASRRSTVSSIGYSSPFRSARGAYTSPGRASQASEPTGAFAGIPSIELRTKQQIMRDEAAALAKTQLVAKVGAEWRKERWGAGCGVIVDMLGGPNAGEASAWLRDSGLRCCRVDARGWEWTQVVNFVG